MPPIITAVAMEYGASSLGVYLDQYGQFVFTFNGEVQTDPLNVGDQDLLPGSSITITLQSPNTIQVYLFNGIMVTIQSDQTSAFSSIQLLVPSSLVGSPFGGLVGQFDGDSTNDFLPQGASTPLSSTSTTQQLQSFGKSWRVADESESLFLYPSGQSYTTINDDSGFIPDYPETLGVDPQLTVTAQQVCQSAGATTFQGDCVFDVVESGSYQGSAASISMGRLYAGYLLGNTRPPSISPMSPSVVSLYLGAAVTVSFGVSDVDGNEFAVFASSAPLTNDVTLANSSNTYTYSLTVTDDLFLSTSITPLVVVAVDSNGLASQSSTSFQIAYSTCADGESKVTTEGKLELGKYCPAGATKCSSECKSVVARLSGLSCLSDISASLGASFSTAQSLCCDGVTIKCPQQSGNQGLSPGASAGIAVGVVVVVLALAAVGAYFAHKKGLISLPAKGKKASSKGKGKQEGLMLDKI